MSDGETNKLLGMSDEDFLNMNGPDDVADPAPTSEPAAESVAAPVVDPTPTPQADDDAGTAAEGSAAAPIGDGEGEDDAGQATITEAPVAPAVPAVAPALDAEGKPVVEAAPAAAPAAPIDYEKSYKEIMKPFKANGKTVEPRSPEEAVSLMQMGANYTRKMQELKPHRSALMMLQQANLMDPEKLSFLIDLDKGDPEAVKKFIKDRGIDPLEIDTSTDPAYLGGNHRVSDDDVAFNEALDEVTSTPVGVAMLQEVQATWDTASKDMLYKNPEVMTALAEQRESGVYAMIVAEVEHQRTMGTLPAQTPFLQAYMSVGAQLVAEQTAGTGNDGSPPAQVAPGVLGTTVASPKSTVASGDKAAAASPSRGTATKAQVFVNPLAMSDDEFLAKMENRV